MSREFGDTQVVIKAPDFSCADLRGADFSGHPLFWMTSKNAELPSGSVAVSGDTPSFVRADLSGADLRTARMYGARARDERLPIPSGDGVFIRFNDGDLEFFESEFRFSPSFGSGIVTDPADWHGLWDLRRSFWESTWEKALLPTELVDWLKEYPPTQPMYGPYCESIVEPDAEANAAEK